MNKVYKTLAVFMVAFGFFMFAGENNEVEAAKKKSNQSFIKKTSNNIKRNIKKTCKKTKRAVVNAGSAVTNKIMDGAVKAKSTITGKKANKTWVKGHYKKGAKSHTKGHFRKVGKSGSSSKKSTPSSKSSNGGIAVGGQPLPPAQDPVSPDFSKSRK